MYLYLLTLVLVAPTGQLETLHYRIQADSLTSCEAMGETLVPISYDLSRATCQPLGNN